MTTTSLRFRGAVAIRSDASALLQSPGDAVLVERGRPRLLLLACPCGCGEELPINLDPRAGPAWHIYLPPQASTISLFPSVWRESGCRSHFIIWRDKILLVGRRDDEFDTGAEIEELARLKDQVQSDLPARGLKSYAEIAEDLDELPWDILMVCRALTRLGLAREGTRKQRGCFGSLKANAHRSNSDQ